MCAFHAFHFILNQYPRVEIPRPLMHFLWRASAHFDAQLARSCRNGRFSGTWIWQMRKDA
jgi:hypothetical protein